MRSHTWEKEGRIFTVGEVGDGKFIGVYVDDARGHLPITEVNVLIEEVLSLREEIERLLSDTEDPADDTSLLERVEELERWRYSVDGDQE